MAEVRRESVPCREPIVNRLCGAAKMMDVWIFLCAFISIINIPIVSCVQSFSRTPQNTSVIRGQSVTLHCSVKDRVGQFQWAKGDYMLGMDPSLPGWPRYSIVQSDAESYNLLIENSKLLDDSEYQCQVTPEQGNPPLQASAYLTVLVPPEMPQIMGHNNGSVIDVTPAETVMQLECVVANGHPAARIEWLRNNVLVTDNVVYSKETINSSKLETAKSVITIPAGSEQHDVVYVCRATNDALNGNWMKTFVKLNVLSAPSTPTITGYNSGQAIRAGDSIRLICVARGGNPLAQVVWFKNNEKIDFSYNSGDDRSENEYSYVVPKADNGAVFRCEASNAATPTPLTAEVTLNVHFPPEQATITGNRLAKAGERLTLTCVSSLSNPRASITWIRKGRQVDADGPNEYTQSNFGGYTTKSRLTITVSEQENNVIYTCNAVSDNMAPVARDNVTLSVLYPPGPPEISGYEENGFVVAGDGATMTCTSVGGNPIATLQWYKGNQLIQQGITASSSGNMMTSVLSFLPTAEDNNAVFKCKASNSATTSPLVDLIRLTVYYEPSGVEVTMDPSEPKAGVPLRLKCVSMPSYPPASIIWVKNNKRLAGFNNGTTPASNGGSMTTNLLTITPTAEDHDTIYYCEATNVYIDKKASDGITISVQFKPVFNRSISPSKIEIQEGNSRTVDMSAKANPLAITYTLYKDGIETTPSSFRIANGILSISDINRGDTGSYALHASNTEGFTFHNFTVNVLFPAEISRITSPVKVAEGETAYFECVGVGNPMVPNMVKWFRSDFDMSRTKQLYEDGKGFLTVYELTRVDSGTFICTADNNLGEPAKADGKLVVKFAPVIDKSRQYTKAAGEHGDTVVLTCNAEGAPTVDFKWTKNGNQIVSDNNKYIISKKIPHPAVHKNNLTVIGIQKSDYGTYQCIASNEMGLDTFDITMDGTSKPDPPYDLSFINATHTTITFSWKPGFSGGLDVKFHVRYRREGSKAYTTTHEIPSGDVIFFTIKGLEKGTKYQIDVVAENILGEIEDEQDFSATTSITENTSVTHSSKHKDNDAPVIIILCVCVFGIFLLALNIGLILFFVRRRKKRLENNSDTTSHTNTIELYGPSKETALYPVTPSDDTRSYGTYEKNMDDLSDDFRNYEHSDQKSTSTNSSNVQCNCYNVGLRTGVRQLKENCCVRQDSSGDEDIKRVFLPPPAYTYSANKMDSPQLNSHKTFLTDSHTYLDDDRGSNWRYEDPYRVGNSRHKGTFDSDGYDGGSQTILYDYDRSPSRQDTRPKSSADHSERSSRPSSRGTNSRVTPPPPPPVRSSSKGAANHYGNAPTGPPLPARNYDLDDLPLPKSDHSSQPRYTPSPGSMGSFSNSPNVITNHNYDGPSVRASPNHVQDDMRGHLV